ncbi:SH3 domain-containing protein [Aliikangiella coralliicola]|uniref:SH3 domain-containing protein n=1 Tax=Aliikangiella coralliicola TaxID=2592383 RepID=A0A545UIP3_9GAMM|nr:SH3 domain-containing protein [Aliikangiella coralliicola]TQV89327.1 SH3 domain-containing protein [Aliikangiella coralliicola]
MELNNTSVIVNKEDKDMAYVTPSGGLNLRKAVKPGSVIKVLRKGAEVDILEEQTWLKVRTKRGDVGYVSADFIDQDPIEAEVSSSDSQPEQPEEKCDIQRYQNTRFIGKTLYADTDFWPCLDRLNQYATACEVSIYVTSSAREPGKTVSGNIVKPASRSNHLIGHAIDMNLQSASGFFNSRKLKKSQFNRLPKEIKQFINLVRDDQEMRWGGDFRNEDPVHIDDSFNVRYPDLWDKKLLSRK